MKSKSFLWGRGVFFALLVLSISVVAPAWAADVSVDCGSGASLQAAVDALPPGGNTITVYGTCTENVGIWRRDDLTIQGPEGGTATLISADENQGVVLWISDSRNFRLVRLVIDGGGQYVDGVDADNSQGRIYGCTIQNTIACGVAAFNGSNVTLGGLQAGRAVLISNHTDCGVYEGESVVTLNGQVTIENINGGVGLQAQGGRANVSSGRLGNTIRNAGTNGVGVYAIQGAVITFNGVNTLQNNGDIGIFATQNSTVILNSNVLQDGTRFFTTIEGHAMAGVMVGDSFLAFYGALEGGPLHQIRNNGTAPATTDAGLLAYRHATVRVINAAVTNNVGPGVYADANSVVDFIDSSITGNTGDGVRVAHLSTARFGGMYTDGTPVPANTVISGNGGAAVSCDETSVAYGDLTGLLPFACKVTTEKKPPKAGGAAASLDAIERRAEERLNRWLERHRPRE